MRHERVLEDDGDLFDGYRDADAAAGPPTRVPGERPEPPCGTAEQYGAEVPDGAACWWQSTAVRADERADGESSEPGVGSPHALPGAVAAGFLVSPGGEGLRTSTRGRIRTAPALSRRGGRRVPALVGTLAAIVAAVLAALGVGVLRHSAPAGRPTPAEGAAPAFPTAATSPAAATPTVIGQVRPGPRPSRTRPSAGRPRSARSAAHRARQVRSRPARPATRQAQTRAALLTAPAQARRAPAGRRGAHRTVQPGPLLTVRAAGAMVERSFGLGR